MSYFSENLNKKLGELGITAYELGKRADLNRQYCYKLTAGDRLPEDETLEKLAPVLGISIDELKRWKARSFLLTVSADERKFLKEELEKME